MNSIEKLEWRQRVRFPFSIGGLNAASIAVVLIVGLGICMHPSEASAIQKPDVSFREFTTQSVATPSELLRVIATLQGSAGGLDVVDEDDSDRLNELAVMANEWFSGMSPQQKKEAEEYFERSFDRNGNPSPDARMMLEQLGISPTLQRDLAQIFKSTNGGNPQRNSEESPAELPTSVRRSESIEKPGNTSHQSSSARREHDSTSESRTSRRRSSLDPQDGTWAESLGEMVKNNSVAGSVGQDVLHPTIHSPDVEESSDLFPGLGTRMLDTIINAPNDSDRSKEKFEARFDRLLVDAVTKSLSSDSAFFSDSVISQSLSPMFDQVIQSVRGAYPQTGGASLISQLDADSFGDTPGQKNTRQATSADGDPTPASERSAIGSLAKSLLGERSPESNANMRMWFGGGVLAVIAAFVFFVFWRTFRMRRAAGPIAKRGKRHPPRSLKIRSLDELVDAVDGFLIDTFGNESHWWNARLAQDVLIAGAPEYERQISELFQHYILARYCPGDARLAMDDQRGFRSTLHELQRFCFTELPPSIIDKSGLLGDVASDRGIGSPKWKNTSVVIGVLVALFHLMCPFDLVGQEDSLVPEAVWKRGYHGVHAICSGLGLEHEAIDSWSQRSPRESVLVVFGELEDLPINVSEFIDAGGAVLLASDRDARSVVSRHGVQFHRTQVEARQRWDAYGGFGDCPVVTDFTSHAIIEGVESIAANRPGALRVGDSNATVLMVGRYPLLSPRIPSDFFMVALENDHGGKLIAVADQSVFSNQMLTSANNSLFTHQAIQWLRGTGRKHLLVVSDGRMEGKVNLGGVVIMPPPPTRTEVLDALGSLPPSVLLKFANSVATVVEDENMVNEFMFANLKKARPKAITRVLIFTTLGIASFLMVSAYFFQKRLMGTTASEIAIGRHRNSRKTNNREMMLERQQAAETLLDMFCWNVGKRRLRQWPAFPAETGLDQVMTPSECRNMEIAAQEVKNMRSSFWTPSRLENLESDTVRWERILRSKKDFGGGQTELGNDSVKSDERV